MLIRYFILLQTVERGMGIVCLPQTLIHDTFAVVNLCIYR